MGGVGLWGARLQPILTRASDSRCPAATRSDAKTSDPSPHSLCYMAGLGRQTFKPLAPNQNNLLALAKTAVNWEQNQPLGLLQARPRAQAPRRPRPRRPRPAALERGSKGSWEGASFPVGLKSQLEAASW